jgi:hypothetical protein
MTTNTTHDTPLIQRHDDDDYYDDYDDDVSHTG